MQLAGLHRESVAATCELLQGPHGLVVPGSSGPGTVPSSSGEQVQELPVLAPSAEAHMAFQRGGAALYWRAAGQSCDTTRSLNVRGTANHTWWSRDQVNPQGGRVLLAVARPLSVLKAM